MKKLWLLLIPLLALTGCSGDPFVTDLDDDAAVIIRGENGDGFENVMIGHDNSLVTITSLHNLNHDGKVFRLADWADVDGAGTTLDFLWITPADKIVHAYWIFAGEAEFTMTLYEDVEVAANGAAVTLHCANHILHTTPEVLAYTGPTLAGGTLGDGGQGGVEVWDSKIGSGKNATLGTDSGDGIIAAQSTYYWFRIEKETAGTGWLDYTFFLTETDE